MAVLRRRHVVVQGGKIVKGDDGQPITDDGPILQTTATLLRVMERHAGLLGLDAIDAETARLEQQFSQSSDPTKTE
jgi:hypothetical protein